MKYRIGCADPEEGSADPVHPGAVLAPPEGVRPWVHPETLFVTAGEIGQSDSIT